MGWQFNYSVNLFQEIVVLGLVNFFSFFVGGYVCIGLFGVLVVLFKVGVCIFLVGLFSVLVFVLVFYVFMVVFFYILNVVFVGFIIYVVCNFVILLKNLYKYWLLLLFEFFIWIVGVVLVIFKFFEMLIYVGIGLLFVFMMICIVRIKGQFMGWVKVRCVEQKGCVLEDFVYDVEVEIKCMRNCLSIECDVYFLFD